MTNAMRTFLVSTLAALAATAALADGLVLAGGTVHTLAGEPFLGNVVIEDGLITAVGPDAAAPAGAETIDAAGLHVYPGMFDALGQIGLVEVGAVAATVDTTEMGAYNPHLGASTAIHPASEVIPVTRETGITQAVVAPEADRDGVISGQACLVHLDGWTVEEMEIQPRIAMVIEWPAIETRSFDFATFTVRETPFKEAEEDAREAQDELRDWLDAARHYAQAMASGNGRLERDLKLEALARVIDGGQKVILLASSRRDIEGAIEFAEEQGLDAVIGGGRDAWMVKDVLAEKQIPVILSRTQSVPEEDDDPYDRAFTNPADLRAAGVKIAFASGAGGGFGPGGPHSARTLPYEAAMAAAYGLPREEALKALTVYPAEILGVDDKLGTIEPGKIANLIVTDGDPLEITTDVRHLVIDGKVSSTDNRHRSLYERYRGRPDAP